MNKSRNILRKIACIRLVEEFKNIRTRGKEIFINLNNIIDKYLKNHTFIEPMFQTLIEDECMDAVLAREMTQDEMKILLDKVGIVN